MKKSIVSVLVIAVLAAVFGGCNYESPLVDDEAATPVADGLLGVWHAVSDEGAGKADPPVALVQKFTDTAYLIQYPVQAKDSLYFRGYGVEIDGWTYLQIQLIGTDKGPVKEADRKYDLVGYRIDGDNLAIRLLNTKVVPKTGGADVLLKAFRDNKDNPELFGDVIRFKRP